MSEVLNISVSIGQDWSGDFAYDQASAGDALIMVFYNNNIPCTQIATENYSGDEGEFEIVPSVKYTATLPLKKTFKLNESSVTYKLFILNLELQEATLLYSGGVAITPDPNADDPDIWDGQYPVTIKTVNSLPGVEYYKAGDQVYLLGDGYYYHNGSDWEKFTGPNSFDDDGLLSGEKIYEKSLTYSKLSGAQVGKNLFDKNTIIPDYYISPATGGLSANSSYNASDWIPVTPSTNYKRLIATQMAFYDINKNYISGGTSIQFITPSNCYFIRISILDANLDTEQLEAGTISTYYENYNHTLEGLKLVSSNFFDRIIKGDYINPKTIENENLKLIGTGKNMFDKDAAITGFYVNSASGLLTSSTAYIASDWIIVSPSTNYYRSYAHQMAFYDKNKKYISGLASGNAFITPNNCYYIRITLVPSVLDTLQVELGSSKTIFEPFRYIIGGPNYFAQRVLSVQSENITFMNIGRNLFNKSTITNGYYVNWASGDLSANASYLASDWIEVEENTDYYRTYAHQMAFYDNNKIYISGLSSGNQFTTPPNAKYIRITLIDTVLDTLQVEIGDSFTFYEPFMRIFSQDSDGTPIYADKLTVEGENSIIQKALGDRSIAIPSTVYLVSTKECSFYWDSLIAQEGNGENYFARFEDRSTNGYPGYGNNFKRFFRFIPPAAEVKNNIKLSIYDKKFELLDSKNFELVVSDITNTTAMTILGIGDSFTQGHNYLNDLQSILGGLTFEGMRINGGFNCEGRGGWTINMYLNSYKNGINGSFSPFLHPTGYRYFGSTQFWNKVINQPSLYETNGFQDKATEIGFDNSTGRLVSPSVNDLMYDDVSGGSEFIFWNGTNWQTISEGTLGTFSLDFPKYASAWNIALPNIITILLGINTFASTTPQTFPSTVSNWVNNINTFINAIKSWNPSINICLLIPPAGADQDGFKQSNQLSERYRLVMWKLAEKMIETWDGEQSNNIYLSDLYNSVDRKYGISKLADQKPFDLYTGTERVSHDNDTVHFNTDGDNQMGERLAGLIQYLRSL